MAEIPETTPKKKLLYIITKSNFGGAQKHVFDVATHVSKEHFEVTVALGGKGLLKDKLDAAGVRTVSIASMNRNISFIKDIASFFRIRSIIAHERPDVVHVHSPKAAGLGALAARLLGVKNIIYTVHGWAFNEDRNPLSKMLILFFSWITILLSHKIITITEREFLETKQLIGARTKVVYIPNGFSIPEYVSREEARTFFAEKIGQDVSNHLLIVTNSELHRNKGLTYAIEAMGKLTSKFPEIMFLIIGDGVLKEELQKLIKKLQLERIVYLLGYINDAARYMKGADIFSLTSTKEGLPYVVLEAGAAAVPAVTTAVGGIPDVITDMKSGILVKTKNAFEIAEGIEYLITHPQKADEFAKKLQQKVIADYSISKMIEKVTALY